MANNRTIPTNADGAVVTFSIKVAGEVIPKTVEVLRMSVTKEINKIATAKITILDGDAATEDFPLSNEELFVPGKELEIFAGHQAEEDLIYKGIIVKHGIQIRPNGNTLLKLECKDAAYKLALGKQSRYFQEVTDTDAIAEILDEYSIENELDDTDVTHSELVMYYAYDWDFILSRADVNAKFCVVDDGVFKMISPDFDQESVLDLQFGATILAFDAEIDSRMQYVAVKSQSWDAANQELLEVEAEEPTLEEQGNLPSSDLAEAGGLAAYVLQHSGNINEEELQAWANAKLQKSRLAKIRGRVKFEGFAGVKPGNMVTLAGVGDRFNGKVFVSGVRQYLAEGEWETDLQFGVEAQWFAEHLASSAPANAQLAPAISGLQVGIVNQIHDDPAGEFRVLVDIPVLDSEAEGTWARVATLDAGENRGFFFRPDVGDEVILGFINDNPRDAIILGLLHSSAKPSAIEAAESNAEKGYVSGSEMKLLFNDEDVVASLETPAGNQLVLSEADSGITIEDQNGNKIVLNSDGISLESAKDIMLKASGDIKVEGINIEQKASAQFKADGGAGAEVTSSAILTLKGSLVQIN